MPLAARAIGVILFCPMKRIHKCERFVSRSIQKHESIDMKRHLLSNMTEWDRMSPTANSELISQTHHQRSTHGFRGNHSGVNKPAPKPQSVPAFHNSMWFYSCCGNHHSKVGCSQSNLCQVMSRSETTTNNSFWYQPIHLFHFNSSVGHNYLLCVIAPILNFCLNSLA